MRRFPCVTALVLLLAATPAAAAVIATGGDVTQIGPPVSTLEGALESDTQIFLFAEQASVTLGAALAVDVDTPGTYDNNNLPPGGAPIAAGVRVDSYFVHYDRVSGNQARSGSVSFDTDILGVLVYAATLDGGSDASLGNPGTAYVPAGSDPNRGPDFGPDAITLSADLRTLSFSLSDNANRVDQLRIVVAAPPIVPEPDTALLLAVGLGLLAARRRR